MTAVSKYLAMVEQLDRDRVGFSLKKSGLDKDPVHRCSAIDSIPECEDSRQQTLQALFFNPSSLPYIDADSPMYEFEVYQRSLILDFL